MNYFRGAQDTIFWVLEFFPARLQILQLTADIFFQVLKDPITTTYTMTRWFAQAWQSRLNKLKHQNVKKSRSKTTIREVLDAMNYRHWNWPTISKCIICQNSKAFDLRMWFRWFQKYFFTQILFWNERNFWTKIDIRSLIFFRHFFWICYSNLIKNKIETMKVFEKELKESSKWVFYHKYFGNNFKNRFELFIP